MEYADLFGNVGGASLGTANRKFNGVAVFTVLLLINCWLMGAALVVTRGVPSKDHEYCWPFTEEL